MRPEGWAPVIGGLLYQRYGAPVPFFINFCSFIPSVILLCFLKIPPAEQRGRTRVRKWIPLLTRIFLVSFLGVNYNVTFVSLVKDAGLGSASYGIALGLLGVGALAGFFLKSKIKKELPLETFPPGMGLLNIALGLCAGNLVAWSLYLVLRHSGFLVFCNRRLSIGKKRR